MVYFYIYLHVFETDYEILCHPQVLKVLRKTDFKSLRKGVIDTRASIVGI